MSKLEDLTSTEPEDAFVPESVSVNLGIKAKVGGPNSYNMANINYTLTGKVGRGHTPEEAKDAAEAIVDEWVSAKLKTIQEKNSQ